MTEKETAVIAAAESQIGAPYVYGAWGGLCAPSYRRQYLGYNPSHTAIRTTCPVLSGKASACAGCKFGGKRAFDCRGFTYWVLREAAGITLTGGGATSQYNTTANWAAKGTIDHLPDCVCCVFRADGKKMLHTGLYIGGGRVIHCSVTVRIDSLADGGWTHYAIPAGLYTEEELSGMDTVVTHRTLRSGSRGEDVRELQETLNTLGYDCGTADGVYGAKTAAAVKAFQAACGLIADGVFGPNSWEALSTAETTTTDTPTVTVIIRGVSPDEAERLKAEWPDMEVIQDG